MGRVMVCVLLAAMAVSAQTKNKNQEFERPVRVYIFTTAAPQDSWKTDPARQDAEDRAWTVKLIQKRIVKKGKFELATDAAAADVVVELTNRAYELTGETSSDIFPTPLGGVTTTTSQDKALTLHFKLTVGEHSEAMTVRSGEGWLGISQADASAPVEIQNWIKANRANILAQRK